MLVFEERGKPEYPEKNSRSKEENQFNSIKFNLFPPEVISQFGYIHL